jgi:hypothetical protein
MIEQFKIHLRQILCGFQGHQVTSRQGFMEYRMAELPRGWNIEEEAGIKLAWSPKVCDHCGWVFADMRENETK